MKSILEFFLTQYTGVNVTNTTAESSLFNSLNGAASIPANTLAVGTVLNLKGIGRIGTSGGGTLQVACKCGSSIITDLNTITPASFAPTRCFWFDIFMACSAVGGTDYTGPLGRLNASGLFIYDGNIAHFKNGNAFPIDTTVANTLDLKATWSTASANNQIIIDAAYGIITGS